MAYLRNVISYGHQSIYDELDIFEGNLKEDIKYHKQMGNKVRYFKLTEVKLKHGKRTNRT